MSQITAPRDELTASGTLSLSDRLRIDPETAAAEEYPSSTITGAVLDVIRTRIHKGEVDVIRNGFCEAVIPESEFYGDVSYGEEDGFTRTVNWGFVCEWIVEMERRNGFIQEGAKYHGWANDTFDRENNAQNAREVARRLARYGVRIYAEPDWNGKEVAGGTTWEQKWQQAQAGELADIWGKPLWEIRDGAPFRLGQPESMQEAINRRAWMLFVRCLSLATEGYLHAAGDSAPISFPARIFDESTGNLVPGLVTYDTQAGITHQEILTTEPPADVTARPLTPHDDMALAAGMCANDAFYFDPKYGVFMIDQKRDQN